MSSHSITNLFLSLVVVFASAQEIINESNIKSMCTSDNINTIICKGDVSNICNQEYFVCSQEEEITAQKVIEGMVCFDGELMSTFTECLDIQSFDDEDEDDNLEAEPTATNLVTTTTNSDDDDEDDGNNNTAIIAGSLVAAGGVLAMMGIIGYKVSQSVGAGAAASSMTAAPAAGDFVTNPLSEAAAGQFVTNPLV